MAFKEIVSLDADVTTAIGGSNRQSGKTNPKSVEGYYLGTKQVESRKSKNGVASLHVLQTATGNLGVWGKTDMDRKMASVPAGAMIRITHTGMQPTPNGEMYKYKVEVDPSNTVDVSSLQTSSESQESEAEEAVTGFSEEPQEEEEEALDEVSPARVAATTPAARTASAAQQDRVRAMLNSARKR